MRKLKILFVFLLFGATVFAQTYLDVKPGYGTLNDAVTANQGNVIYRLQAGQWYGLNGIIENNGFPLKIIGTTPATGQMPAEIQTGTNSDGTVLSEMFNMIGDVTLKNLFVVNANQNDVFGAAVFWSSSSTSITLSIDSCVFDPTGATMIRWATTPHPNLFMTNSQVLNLGDLNSEWTGNLFDTSTEPGNGLDTLYLENNTFLSTGMLLIFNSSFTADSENVFWINHNSFIFHKLQFIWDWRMNKYFVTNNLFFDYSTSPTTVKSNVYFPDGDTTGPESRFALINQDTAYYDSVGGKLLSNRQLFVEYNSNYTDPRFQDIATTWAETHTVNNDGVTPIPASYLVPLMYPSDSAGVNREAQMCSDKTHFPYFYEGNYLDNLMGTKPNTDPQFADSTFYKVQDLLVAWTLPTMEIAQWGFDPNKVSPQPAQAGDWFWHADTSYGNPVTWPRVNASYKNPTLLTASIEGLPLGDLNWFPAQKAIWQQNQSTIMQHILSENTSTIGISPTNTTEWDFTKGLDGWGSFWNMTSSYSTKDSAVVLTITGQYPHLFSPDHLSINASSVESFSVVMKNNSDVSNADFYWITNADSNYSEGQTTSTFPITSNDTVFKEYTVPLSNAPGWTGTIRQLRIDPAHNGTSGTVELKKLKLNYYTTAVDQEKSNIPHVYNLSQNYPNPFNPSTEINYSIPKSGFVTLKVYNLLGQEVATLVNKNQNSGNYTINFNASQLTSGVYMYRIQAGDFSLTKKMILLK